MNNVMNSHDNSIRSNNASAMVQEGKSSQASVALVITHEWIVSTLYCTQLQYAKSVTAKLR